MSDDDEHSDHSFAEVDGMSHTMDESWPNYSPSNLPSVEATPAVSRQPSVAPLIASVEPSHTSPSLISDMAQALVEEDEDGLALEHIESFNLLCAGESGLGKSTFLRNIFAHVDPTKLHEMRRRVAEQSNALVSLEDAIRRNEQESRQCDDTRSLQLREEKAALKVKRDEARAALERLRQARREQEQAVSALRADIYTLDLAHMALGVLRDAEEDDGVASRLGHEVIVLQGELKGLQQQLAAELRRSNLDKEEDETAGGAEGGGHSSKQTTEVTARLIKEMPLFDGSRSGLDVSLIDTPGYGDLLVDTADNSSADKVVSEVESRISAHLRKVKASRANMPLDDEKKYWNELVHLCLFFISPHRMKRADVDLMKRLHALVPLVVVVAKSDTMTTAEALWFKERVRQQLKDERIATFTFQPRMIKEVEALHISQAGSGFQPLYGGSDGSLPWAVMGAEDSRREYIWGTAMTNEPRHSELPALRDLLLRQGGWQQLKREASLKADEEGARRAKMNHQRQSWSPSKALALPRSVVLTAGLALLLALTLALSARGAYPLARGEGSCRASLLEQRHLSAAQAERLTQLEDTHEMLAQERLASTSLRQQVGELKASVREALQAKAALQREADELQKQASMLEERVSVLKISAQEKQAKVKEMEAKGNKCNPFGW